MKLPTNYSLKILYVYPFKCVQINNNVKLLLLHSNT